MCTITSHLQLQIKKEFNGANKNDLVLVDKFSK